MGPAHRGTPVFFLQPVGIGEAWRVRVRLRPPPASTWEPRSFPRRRPGPLSASPRYSLLSPPPLTLSLARNRALPSSPLAATATTAIPLPRGRAPSSAQTPATSPPSHASSDDSKTTSGALHHRPHRLPHLRMPKIFGFATSPSDLPRAHRLLQPTRREPLPPLPLLSCSFSHHGHRSAGDQFAPPPELLAAVARGHVHHS